MLVYKLHKTSGFAELMWMSEWKRTMHNNPSFLSGMKIISWFLFSEQLLYCFSFRNVSDKGILLASPLPSPSCHATHITYNTICSAKYKIWVAAKKERIVQASLTFPLLPAYIHTHTKLLELWKFCWEVG